MTARELRELRERLGLTQDQMAEELGAVQPTYAKWEAGRSGRDYRLEPDLPIPSDIAERARKIRPVSESRYQLTEEELRVRNCIDGQVCPFCGRGGWKMLARHTKAAHGVSARELREMAALPMDASICAPSHADSIRTTRQAHMEAIAPKGGAMSATRRGEPVHLTRGGVVGRARANRRAAGLEAAPPPRKSSKAKRRERNAAIVERIQDGEHPADVARDLGLTKPYVYVLYRQGSDQPLPPRQWGRRWDRGSVIQALHDWTKKHGRLPKSTDANQPRNGLPSIATVRRALGIRRWAEVYEVLGVDPPRAHMRRADPEKIRRARERLGWTHDKLANILGVNGSTLEQWEDDEVDVPAYLELALAYLCERPEQYARKRPKKHGRTRKLSDSVRAEIRERDRQGTLGTLREAAAEYGVSRQTIANILRETDA